MNNNVSVGPATSIGLVTAFTAFIGSLITYLTGDHTAQTVTALETGGAGLVILVVTLAGRYLQAHKLISSGIAGDINKAVLDPSTLSRIEKLLNISTSEEPKTEAGSLPVAATAPVLSDQSKLTPQFSTAQEVPPVQAG